MHNGYKRGLYILRDTSSSGCLSGRFLLSWSVMFCTSDSRYLVVACRILTESSLLNPFMAKKEIISYLSRDL